MTRIATIELGKENMSFSVAHFTIFSATERENLHGHNYSVQVSLEKEVADIGLSFDYRFYKQKLRTLCKQLHQSVLLPTRSPYLTISEDNGYYHAVFADEKMYFLKRDVTLLPVVNISVEELTSWFIQQLLLDKEQLAEHHIQAITVKVFSAPGQGGSTSWRKFSD